MIESMSMEQWWYDTDRSKLKYSDKILSHYHIFHHKTHVYWPGMKLVSLQSQGRQMWIIHPLILNFTTRCQRVAPNTLP
jgi:hypothetical protein